MKAVSETNSKKPYSSDNLRKYQSSNPLKHLLIGRMQNVILDLCENCARAFEAPRILDAGCGEGINAVLLEKRIPEAKLTLLDTSEEALTYASGLCSARCAYCCASVTDLPFPDNSFDLVLCSEVLEHLDRPDLALSELLRVASGCVLISVPHEPWFRMGNFLALQNVRRWGDPPDHLNHWTLGGFQRWIRSCSNDWTAVFFRSFPWSIAILRREIWEYGQDRGG